MEHITVSAVGDDLSERCALIPFNVNGLAAAEACRRFASKGITIQSRVRDAYSKHALENLGLLEMIRFSASHYTSPQEIDYFLKAAEEIRV